MGDRGGSHRRMAREMGQYHPDKVATLGPEIRALAERKTRELNQAYEDAMRGR